MLGVWFRIRWAFISPLIWAPDKGCLEADGLRGIEIEIVTSHHAALVGLKLQVVCCPLVSFRQRFVFPGCLAR